MAFTLFYLLEACLLVANAIAILNDRFLKQSKSSLGEYGCHLDRSLNISLFGAVGFHVDQMNMNA